ncbi:MAG: hypothetical protein Q9166_002871 [cf. Caloplaca sp. 2 TL-2023]
MSEPDDQPRKVMVMPGPADLMVVGHSAGSRNSINLQKAIRMAEEKATANGVRRPEEYAAFVANLFTVSSMENLHKICRNFNPEMPLKSYCPTPNVKQVAGEPDVLRQLIIAYLDTQLYPKMGRAVLGAAFKNYLQCLFHEKFSDVRDQICTKKGPIWEFSHQRNLQANRKWYNEVIHFIVERAGCQTRDQVTNREWQNRYKKVYLASWIGEFMYKLKRRCTESVFLVLAMGDGEKSRT